MTEKQRGGGGGGGAAESPSKGKGRRAAWIAAAVAVAVTVVGMDPLRLSVMSHYPDLETHGIQPPGKWADLNFGFDPQERLQQAQVRFRNDVQGPECIAFDPQGRGPYTGTADGRIMRWDGLIHGWTQFAYTSPNMSWETCPPRQAREEMEHVCGRPLGLRFDPRTGDLYIADAYKGLLRVGPHGGLAQCLCNEVAGQAVRFANDLDIDHHGNVYFTDSSARYQRRQFMQAIFSTEASGRLLVYSTVSGESRVLAGDLHFPNGLSLSGDGRSLIMAGGPGVLYRYWLAGGAPHRRLETFAVLPGYGDNVRVDEHGDVWVAMHFRRNRVTHELASRPRLRKAIYRLPIPPGQHYLGMIGGRSHGLIARYDAHGRLLDLLQDSRGSIVRSASHVLHHQGRLWIGSVIFPYIAVLNYSSSSSYSSE